MTLNVDVSFVFSEVAPSNEVELFGKLKNFMGDAKKASIRKLIDQEINLNIRNRKVLTRIAKELSPNLPNVRELICKILQSHANMFEFIHEDFRNDFEIVKLACKGHDQCLSLVSNRDFILKLISNTNVSFEYLPKEFENDNEIIFNLLYKHCWYDSERKQLLESNNFRIDKSLVSIYSQRYYFIQFADESLRSDKEFMSRNIKRTDGKSFRYASEDLRTDEKMIMEILQYSRQLYEYLPIEMKSEEFALKAFNNNMGCYKYLSNESKQAAVEIVKEKVTQNGLCFISLPTIFKINAIALAAFASNCSFSFHKFLFKNLSKELRNDRQFALGVVSLNGYALFRLDKEFRSDREIVLRAVKTFWFALSIASYELRGDYEIVLEACRGNRKAYKYSNLTGEDRIALLQNY